MGKKKLRAKYTSKGTGESVAKSNRVEISLIDKELNKLKAFHQGRKVMVTIPNPNTNETNRKFIRVNAATIYGDWKSHAAGVIEQKKEKKKK